MTGYEICNAKNHIKLNLNRERFIENQISLTSKAAIVTVLCGDGINLSILRYLSTSARVCFTSSMSSDVYSFLLSVGRSSPLSGGAVETAACAAAEIMVLM